MNSFAEKAPRSQAKGRAFRFDLFVTTAYVDIGVADATLIGISFFYFRRV
jgi:hypothetical protein